MNPIEQRFEKWYEKSVTNWPKNRSIVMLGEPEIKLILRQAFSAGSQYTLDRISDEAFSLQGKEE